MPSSVGNYNELPKVVLHARQAINAKIYGDRPRAQDFQITRTTFRRPPWVRSTSTKARKAHLGRYQYVARGKGIVVTYTRFWCGGNTFIDVEQAGADENPCAQCLMAHTMAHGGNRKAAALIQRPQG